MGSLTMSRSSSRSLSSATVACSRRVWRVQCQKTKVVARLRLVHAQTQWEKVKGDEVRSQKCERCGRYRVQLARFLLMRHAHLWCAQARHHCHQLGLRLELALT